MAGKVETNLPTVSGALQGVERPQCGGPAVGTESVDSQESGGTQSIYCGKTVAITPTPRGLDALGCLPPDPVR